MNELHHQICLNRDTAFEDFVKCGLVLFLKFIATEIDWVHLPVLFLLSFAGLVAFINLPFSSLVLCARLRAGGGAMTLSKTSKIYICENIRVTMRNSKAWKQHNEYNLLPGCYVVFVKREAIIPKVSNMDRNPREGSDKE